MQTLSQIYPQIPSITPSTLFNTQTKEYISANEIELRWLQKRIKLNQTPFNLFIILEKRPGDIKYTITTFNSDGSLSKPLISQILTINNTLK